MSTHKNLDKICLAVVTVCVLLTILCLGVSSAGGKDDGRTMGYEDKLFDTESVHTIDILIEDWESFLETCTSEEYSACTVVIDGETYANVGIRGKGNTSLSTVATMDSQRYSFKLEFDQYDSSINYHGLDKLSLNNLIQDNTYMKDYLTYRMMAEFGVDAPLCSYVYITVNGEDWGLYLAVEGVEESFLQRNYGSDYGELYKPDSMSFGNGNEDGGFSMGSFGSSDVKLQYIDDDPDSYSNIFNNAKTDVTEADQTRLIASLKALSEGENIEDVVDVEEVIRYFVVHNFVCNGDSYTGTMIHNYYLYEENGKLSMIPWDYNLAFGTFQSSDATDTVNTPIDDPVTMSMGDDARPMLDWIFASEEYTALYHQYFEEFLANVDFEELIGSTAEMIAPYVERDPTSFCTYEEFEAGVSALRSFCLLREESVEGQLNGTIPSTSEGQSAETSARVDASGLTISDMGTMGMSFGGGGFSFGGRSSMASFETASGEASETLASQEIVTQEESADDGTSSSEMSASGEISDVMSLFGGASGEMSFSGDMSFPGNMNFSFSGEMTQNSGIGTGGYILLAMSLVILLGGLLFAWKFKR